MFGFLGHKTPPLLTAHRHIILDGHVFLTLWVLPEVWELPISAHARTYASRERKGPIQVLPNFTNKLRGVCGVLPTSIIPLYPRGPKIFSGRYSSLRAGSSHEQEPWVSRVFCCCCFLRAWRNYMLAGTAPFSSSLAVVCRNQPWRR